MSANLEAMILGKPAGNVTNIHSQFVHMTAPKGGKSRFRLLIGHTIFFTSEKNRMTNEIASVFIQ